jgi:hypothetical protein
MGLLFGCNPTLGGGCTPKGCSGKSSCLGGGAGTSSLIAAAGISNLIIGGPSGLFISGLAIGGISGLISGLIGSTSGLEVYLVLYPVS